MSRSYDAAVIGAGVFGSWTAYYLQRAGLSVALIDAYGAANNRASSGGESRIIRMGYGADEVYTRWSHGSLAVWQEFFASVGRQELFHRTGVLLMAHENDPRIIATRRTLERVGVNFEFLNRDELERRYPQIDFGEVRWAIYEPMSGALMARRAVQSVADFVARNGGNCLTESALAPAGSGRLNEIVTRGGSRIGADVFVFACGPWLPKLFPALLGDRIHPTRQEVYFFGVPAGDTRFAPPLMPTWLDFSAEAYGLPDLENRGFKLAFDLHGEAIDPDTAERNVTGDSLDLARAFMAQRFPALADAPLVEARVCQYENTSNGDFLIDRHPDFDNVWLAGGGSGHGFKHGPALGEYVAARVVEGGEIERRFTLATKETSRMRTVF
ncbi:MAG TPA: FAD-dependent oxidoreductase [Blastocatellia bacterium]|jgi:monomeric sarcosine oxidase|nr:FAD-dependent oxidoreductase [Blastocatellia bacterium]